MLFRLLLVISAFFFASPASAQVIEDGNDGQEQPASSGGSGILHIVDKQQLKPSGGAVKFKVFCDSPDSCFSQDFSLRAQVRKKGYRFKATSLDIPAGESMVLVKLPSSLRKAVKTAPARPVHPAHKDTKRVHLVISAGPGVEIASASILF
jgi:hypothetical protein